MKLDYISFRLELILFPSLRFDQLLKFHSKWFTIHINIGWAVLKPEHIKREKIFPYLAKVGHPMSKS